MVHRTANKMCSLESWQLYPHTTVPRGLRPQFKETMQVHFWCRSKPVTTSHWNHCGVVVGGGAFTSRQDEPSIADSVMMILSNISVFSLKNTQSELPDFVTDSQTKTKACFVTPKALVYGHQLFWCMDITPVILVYGTQHQFFWCMDITPVVLVYGLCTRWFGCMDTRTIFKVHQM